MMLRIGFCRALQSTTSSWPVATILLSVLLFLTITRSSIPVDAFGNIEDPVQDAIDKSRQHLANNTPKDAPFAFPNTRYRLAMMLESKLPEASTLDAQQLILKECCQLYQQAAKNHTSPIDASKRIFSLYRAAEIMLDVLDPSEIETVDPSLESLLWMALDVPVQENNDEDDLAPLYATIFEKLVRRLLSKAATASNRNEDKSQYLTDAIRLCDKCSTLCPFEPVVDEYRGAVLREVHGTGRKNAFILDAASSSSSDKSTASKGVYGAYEAAAHKSNSIAMEVLAECSPKNQKKLRNCPYGSIPKLSKSAKTELKANVQTSEENSAYAIDLWSRLVRHIVLAACSAREAGLSKLEQQHWKYGRDILSFVNDLIEIPNETQADFYTNVGIHYKKLSNNKKAAEFFQKALYVNPNDGHALVQLASVEDEQSSGSSSTGGVMKLDDSYVAGLFDGYSQRFEKELVEELQYKGHELVANALFSQQQNWTGDTPNDKETMKTIKVVDIGCGTGLLGELIRMRFLQKEDSNNDESSSRSCTSMTLTLTGVDLSPRMVALSNSRTIKLGDGPTGDASSSEIVVYDNVKVSDAVEYLSSIPSNDINAITASDVFIYVGALDEIFQQCSRVLRKGGLLVFTVEFPQKGESLSKHGVKLLKSGRFGHSRKHVKEVAEKSGFELATWEDAVLRTQGGIDVPGAAVVLRKN